MDAPVVGRRVLVATVGGALGQRIQAWREKYDPRQALRLLPHLTVCYRPPVDASLETLERQVRHAFPTPVTVKLGQTFVLAHPEAPLAVSVHQTAELDRARQLLFDATHAALGGRHEWPWHITCIRYGAKRDLPTLLARAADELALDDHWTIDTISYLELRGARYEPVVEWRLSAPPTA